jgi:hypothetical protein
MPNFAVWLERRIAIHSRRQETGTQRALSTLARQMQREMKSTHPWTNRTGDAEKSVGAVLDPPHKVGNETTFTIRAGYVNTPHVSYGIWLELAHAGRFAIVRPTVLHYRSRVATDVAQSRRVL